MDCTKSHYFVKVIQLMKFGLYKVSWMSYAFKKAQFNKKILFFRQFWQIWLYSLVLLKCFNFYANFLKMNINRYPKKLKSVEWSEAVESLWYCWFWNTDVSIIMVKTKKTPPPRSNLPIFTVRRRNLVFYISKCIEKNIANMI